MKNLIKNLSLILTLLIGGNAIAQEAKVIQLTQVQGDFKEKKELNLKAGEAYIFEVTNEGVDHKVGFVITPKGKTTQEHHIQNAYVQETIENGSSSRSKEVILKKGEYEYFCPMNPTPHYTIVVN